MGEAAQFWGTAPACRIDCTESGGLAGSTITVPAPTGCCLAAISAVKRPIAVRGPQDAAGGESRGDNGDVGHYLHRPERPIQWGSGTGRDMRSAAILMEHKTVWAAR